MGFRFQKRIKIAPGVRLNISKGGLNVLPYLWCTRYYSKSY
ncbi:DUF4236 domain-containing protein [Sporosarcina koreensis]|uniref:DUF4236 domain-containing protein n=1 Tax=Sporosarcina koreensis TaxID=334735 RepID=A0ABW0TWE9_9BACL